MSALAFNGSSTLLASAQEGPLGVLRLWDFPKGSCLAVFQTHVRAVLSLRYVPALEGMHPQPWCNPESVYSSLCFLSQISALAPGSLGV